MLCLAWYRISAMYEIPFYSEFGRSIIDSHRPLQIASYIQLNATNDKNRFDFFYIYTWGNTNRSVISEEDYS